MHLTLKSPVKIPKIEKIKSNPLAHHIAAVSVGIYRGQPVLDLDYPEDSDADTDMNVVMGDDGGIIEIQGTAEAEPFSEAEFSAMLALSKKGIAELHKLQRQALAGN